MIDGDGEGVKKIHSLPCFVQFYVIFKFKFELFLIIVDSP